MATTYTWNRTAAGSYSWNVTSSWSHPVTGGGSKPGLPIAGSDILFTGSASLTVTYNLNTSIQYDALLLNETGVTLQFTAGTGRTFNANFTPGNTVGSIPASNIDVRAGTLSFGTPGTAVPAFFHTINTYNFTVDGGTVIENARGVLNVALSNAGTASPTGLLRIQSGTFTDNGGAITTNALAVSGGTLADAGGTISANTISLTGGLVTGYGTIGGTISGAAGGQVIADGGTLDLTGNINNGGLILGVSTNAGSVLKLDGTIASGDTVSFAGLNVGVVEIGNATALAGFNAIVAGLGNSASIGTITGSNFLNIQGVTIARADVGSLGSNVFDGSASTIKLFSDLAGSNLVGTIALASAPTLGAQVIFGLDNVVGSGAYGGFDVYLVCYAAGTLILTEHGEVPVEALEAGDRVIALVDGQPVAQPIKWMGHRSVNISSHPHPHLAAPIRIRANAFGPGQPRRDLLVSPAHGIYIGGKLIPANLLVNHMTITQELHTKSVTYHHVELDRHAILLAENLPAESYLDTGNRAFFENAGMAMVLHPEFHVNAGLKCWEDDACAPLAVDAATVTPVWRMLTDRAEAMGYTRPDVTVTEDADIHLLADGTPLRPIASAHGRFTFMLPAGVTDLRLASRASAPADIDPLCGDWRPLGVALRTMTLRAGDGHQVIPADHPSLVQGWHTAERDTANLWRWTNGNATLPVPAQPVPALLDIELGQHGRYVIARGAPAQRLAA